MSFELSTHVAGEVDALPEELRCQYSSKRCENPRTNKKSGGLHKFCAMHREKANRNQMRLDHRRRVLKKQMQMQMREQQEQEQQQQQRQRALSAPAAMAAGMRFSASPPAHARAFRGYAPTTTAAHAPTAPDWHQHHRGLVLDMDAAAVPESNLFSALDLQILEALLFSDEEQGDAKSPHCSDAAQPPMLLRSPSFVNV
jgi:hypothetical protein